MSTLNASIAAAVVAASTTLAAPAAAETLDIITNLYGSNAEHADPIGDDVVHGDHVRIFDTSTATGYTQFIEIFDFNVPYGSTIEEFKITLTYSRIAAEEVITNVQGENWYARVLGDQNSTLDEDYFETVMPSGPTTGVMSFSLTAEDDTPTGGGQDRPDGTPTTNTAFQTSVDEGRVRLRFREESGGEDNFVLFSTQLEVIGTLAPIPVPASGLLLLGALGGAAALRRQRKA